MWYPDAQDGTEVAFYGVPREILNLLPGKEKGDGAAKWRTVRAKGRNLTFFLDVDAVVEVVP